MIKIREYTPSDLPEIAQLFYDTVHTVNAADYDDEQLDAWADGSVDVAEWNVKKYLTLFHILRFGNGVV